MDINSLHEHNREAYLKVMQHFNEGHQKACVVHATGTGKSMIITAVSDHFERVLILTTNMFTIEQVDETFKKYSPERTAEPTFMIYQALLQQMRDDVDYSHAFDLIVFDEFHHGGAEEWGKAVNWIIEQNPSAKVLGTSATAIRHSDGGRDMGDELFDGNVLSRLPLGEAWARKILMAPYYIMAVEDSEEFHNEFIKKIEESKLLEEKKHFYREMASYLKDNYEMEKNAADIIRKWLPSDSRRVIVFSRNIEEAESNVSKVEGWMKKAGFNVDNIYMVHSQRPFEEKKAQMMAFQTDNFNGIKIMVAVDMLNEGVHIPRVDAVFFLRKTESPTIFLQQMGRCMGLYKEGGRRPVVFDFRNNVENTNRSTSTRSFFGEAAKDYDNWKELEEESLDSQTIRDTDKKEKLRENFPDGINYTMDYGVMLDRFGEDLSNVDWDANYAEAKAFFDKNGRFPTDSENRRLNQWAGQWWRNNCLKNPVINQKKMNKLTLIGYKHCTTDEMYDELWEKNYKDAKDFFDKNGRFPMDKENTELRHWAVYWWRYNYMKNPELYQKKADRLTAIGFKYRNNREKIDELWSKNFEECRDWYEKMNYFPTKSENKKLYMWVYHWWKFSYLKNPELHQEKAHRLTAIGFVYWSAKDRTDELWMKNYKEAKEFFDKNGHFPTKEDHRRLKQWACNWWRNNCLKNPVLNQEKAGMLKTIGFVYQSQDDYYNELWMKNYEEAKEFFDKNGHFPTKVENRRLNQWAWNWWKITYLNNLETQRPKMEMLTRIGYDFNKKVNLLMEYAHQAEEYYIKYGKKIPRSGVYEKAYITLMNFWRDNIRRAKRPDIVNILLKSGFKNRL